MYQNYFIFEPLTITKGKSACRILVAGFFYAYTIGIISGSALRCDNCNGYPTPFEVVSNRPDRAANYLVQNVFLVMLTTEKTFVKGKHSTQAKADDLRNRSAEKLYKIMTEYFSVSGAAHPVENVTMLLDTFIESHKDRKYYDHFLIDTVFETNRLSALIVKLYENMEVCHG